MIEDNEKQKKAYESIHEKVSGEGWQSWEARQERIKKLTPKQQEIYFKGSQLYSNASIKRVRIELNKAMIEWEKGE